MNESSKLIKEDILYAKAYLKGYLDQLPEEYNINTIEFVKYDYNYDCVDVNYDKNLTKDIVITFCSEYKLNKAKLSTTAINIKQKDIDDCDLLKFKDLFETEAGRSHLSRFLLGKESCLVKDWYYNFTFLISVYFIISKSLIFTADNFTIKCGT